MATLPTDSRGQALQAPQLGTQLAPIAYTAASAQAAAAFSANTNAIRVVSTTACYIKFGSNPSATVNDTYLPAGWVEYFRVTPGEKIAAIRASADGVLHVTEINLQ